MISFCGHKDFTYDVELSCKVVDLLIYYAAMNKQLDCFTGGCGAFDRFAAHCINIAKRKVNNIRNCLVIAYLRVANNRDEFDEIIYPPLENVPLKYAILRRNKWMIDNSHLVIAYVRHGWGGAAKMCAYAEKKNKNIIYL